MKLLKQTNTTDEIDRNEKKNLQDQHSFVQSVRKYKDFFVKNSSVLYRLKKI